MAMKTIQFTEEDIEYIRNLRDGLALDLNVTLSLRQAIMHMLKSRKETKK